jgi:hypothetical protein
MYYEVSRRVKNEKIPSLSATFIIHFVVCWPLVHKYPIIFVLVITSCIAIIRLESKPVILTTILFVLIHSSDISPLRQI